MEELARQFAATRNPEIREELYELAREFEKMEKESRSKNNAARNSLAVSKF